MLTIRPCHSPPPKKNMFNLKMFRKYYKRWNFVTNSIKYANCSQIDCTIYSKENTIYLEIKDNGIGFDLESVKKGMGLNNMHKRAFLCGAKLELETILILV